MCFLFLVLILKFFKDLSRLMSFIKMDGFKVSCRCFRGVNCVFLYIYNNMFYRFLLRYGMLI